MRPALCVKTASGPHVSSNRFGQNRFHPKRPCHKQSSRDNECKYNKWGENVLYWTTPEIGQRMVDVALSLHAYTLETYQFDSVLANYGGFRASLKTLDAIGLAIEELEKEISPYGGIQGEYLKGTLLALKGFTRVMCGDKMSYAEKMRDIMELPMQPIPQSKYEGLRETVDCQLTDLGYRGGTMEKIAGWKADHFIPTEQVIDFARQYLDACKKATLARVTTLPEEDAISELYGVRGEFWSGHSSYCGNFKGRLRFNLDRPWSGPTFINILAHEGYPGHQVSYCRWDWLFQQGLYPVEASWYMLASPANTVFEGLPENGTHFLGWDQPGSAAAEIPEELKPKLALAWDISDLQRIVQTRACMMYNADGASRADVMEYFEKTAIFSEVEARNTFRFFSHPIQHIQYPSYYYGRWMVRQAWDLCPEGSRDQLFALLYDTPMSNHTFIRSVEAIIGMPFTPFETI